MFILSTQASNAPELPAPFVVDVVYFLVDGVQNPAMQILLYAGGTLFNNAALAIAEAQRRGGKITQIDLAGTHTETEAETF